MGFKQIITTTDHSLKVLKNHVIIFETNAPVSFEILTIPCRRTINKEDLFDPKIYF